MIARSTKVKILDKEYEVRYPLPGDMLQIESLKQILTNNTYGQLSKSGHDTAEQFLDLVDAFSYFTVLVPELGAKFTTTYFNNVDPLEAIKLRRSFFKYNAYMTTVNKEISELLKTEDEAENGN